MDKVEQSSAAEGRCRVGSKGLCVHVPGFLFPAGEYEMPLKLKGEGSKLCGLTSRASSDFGGEVTVSVCVLSVYKNVTSVSDIFCEENLSSPDLSMS